MAKGVYDITKDRHLPWKLRLWVFWRKLIRKPPKPIEYEIGSYRGIRFIISPSLDSPSEATPGAESTERKRRD